MKKFILISLLLISCKPVINKKAHIYKECESSWEREDLAPPVTKKYIAQYPIFETSFINMEQCRDYLKDILDSKDCKIKVACEISVNDRIIESIIFTK